MAQGRPATIGPYTITGELGRGGMGVVYRARDPQLGRDVALKVLPSSAPQELRERFLREGRVAARLRHPNVVSILAAGEDDGVAWLAQDLIEGRPLDRILHEEVLAPAQAAELVEQIARAVGHAHAEGVIHRDIKPGNILVDRAGVPHLADFGLARDVEGSAKLSKSGQVYGTAHYMSPEQARGVVGGLDGRTDVWALGVVLYDCLANALPFEGDTALAVLSKVIGDEPRPLRSAVPDAPAALGVIITKCLEKDPGRRYATAEALADDLARWRGGDAILATPPTLAFRAARWARRNRRALLLGGGLAVAGLTTTAVLVVPELRESARLREASERARQAAEQRAQAALREKAEEAERLERARPHLDRGRRILARLDRLLGQADWTRAQADRRAREAQDEFTRALEAYPGHPDALLELARSWLLLDEKIEALRWLNQAAEVHPGNIRIRLARGLVRMDRYADLRGNALGRAIPETQASAQWLEAAQSDLRFVKEHGTDEEEFEFAAALLQFATGRRAAAAPRLQAYAEQRLTDAQAWNWAAYAWVAIAENAKGEAALTTLLKLRPRSATGLLRRSVARFALGRLEEAQADCDRLFAITDTFAPAYVNRGALRFTRGDTEGALADYDRAAQLDDDDPIVYSNRAVAHLTLGHLDAAEADFARAIALVPEYKEAYSNRASLHSTRGDHDKALADCARALAIDPDFPPAHFSRAVALEGQGDLDGATAAVTRALELRPGYFKAAVFAADLYAKRGDLPAARAGYERVLAADPRWFPALMNLGVTLMQQQEYTAAEQLFTRAIAVRPKFWNIHKNRGLVRAILRDYDGAVADLQRAVDLAAPGTPDRADAEHWLRRISADAQKRRR
ncbi:MAG: protein kinase domain-containing protein [Planctomycetota bacterium]|jgi:tetratricopeptide (TPR) repeat protein